VNTAEAPSSLALLGTFDLRVGGVHVELPRPTERLLAFLALQRQPVNRHRVAGALWPDVAEERSLGSLRSALWRLRRTSHEVVEIGDANLRLDPTTVLDIEILGDRSRELHDDSDLTGTPDVDASMFGAELLPGWYDDWLLFERERLRQVSLHALEALSRRQVRAGRYADAVEAAWRAISLEPLRESAHGALIDAHLAEGNICEAVRSFREYSSVLRREVGVAPSPALRARMSAAVKQRGGSGEMSTVSVDPGLDARKPLRRDSEGVGPRVDHHARLA
jgi:DNA-binding SARP family transcriptional activator